MPRILLILVWSIVPAAFIGPGTVTTAASAGAAHGYALLWALTFSTIATLVLQEASARVAVVSGKTLGEALREVAGGGAAGVLVLGVVLGAIVLGNAAFEAGNILGAAAGAGLGADVPSGTAALAIGAVAFALLWTGAPRTVATLLAITVGVMGIAFLATAISAGPDLGEVVRGSIVPVVPPGAGLLVLGLVGTTVVPYNLFLGSGIAKGQTLPEIRFGLGVAVILGGIISMGIVVVGAQVEGPFSYEAVSTALSARLGSWAGPLFAWGLFAAGFSSCVTAPLAAAVTARSLFDGGTERWSERGWRYRAVWMGVLGVGIVFGLSGIRPIPAIIAAQALNGVVLPLAAVSLFVVVNDRRLMGERGMNGPLANLVMGAVVAVTLLLGSTGIARAGASALGTEPPSEGTLFAAAAVLALLLAGPVGLAVRRRRAGVPGVSPGA